jgi:hypothetical protein
LPVDPAAVNRQIAEDEVWLKANARIRRPHAARS